MKVVYGSLNLTASPYLIEFGTDVGAPKNISEVLSMLLQDGEIEVSSRTSNRTLSFSVLIEGPDPMKLAEAEAALVAETERPRNTVALTPEDDFAPTTVFDTFRGQLEQVFDDNLEQNLMRRFVLTVNASPFGRSADEVVTEATTSLPVSPVTTVVDSGASTTGWTGSQTPTTSGGAVRVAGPSLGRYLTRTGTVDMSVTPYLQIVVTTPVAAPFSANVDVFADGVTLDKVSETQAISGALRTITITVRANSFASLRIVAPFSGAGDLAVDSITKTNVAPVLGTARQKTRRLEVGGSVRTQGSLAIEHETSALGTVLAYTYPGDEVGYVPSLRARRATGNSVYPDASLVSGAYEGLGGFGLSYRIPTASVPSGSYLFMARMRCTLTTPQSVLWAASTKIGATIVAGGTSGSPLLTFDVANAWQYQVLGRMILPPTKIADEASADVVIALGQISADNMEIDEAWLFNTTIGELTQVSCGTATPTPGGTSNRLWIDSPSLDDPVGGIYRGTSSTRSDAFHAGQDVVAFPNSGSHEFYPPATSVFTVTDNALDAAVSFRHFERWHTNAAR